MDNSSIRVAVKGVIKVDFASTKDYKDALKMAKKKPQFKIADLAKTESASVTFDFDQNSAQPVINANSQTMFQAYKGDNLVIENSQELESDAQLVSRILSNDDYKVIAETIALTDFCTVTFTSDDSIAFKKYVISEFFLGRNRNEIILKPYYAKFHRKYIKDLVDLNVVKYSELIKTVIHSTLK